MIHSYEKNKLRRRRFTCSFLRPFRTLVEQILLQCQITASSFVLTVGCFPTFTSSFSLCFRVLDLYKSRILGVIVGWVKLLGEFYLNVIICTNVYVKEPHVKINYCYRSRTLSGKLQLPQSALQQSHQLPRVLE